MALNAEQRTLIERRTAEINTEIVRLNKEIAAEKDRLGAFEKRKTDLLNEIKRINEGVQ